MTDKNGTENKPRKLKDWLWLGWELAWDWKKLEPHLRKELRHAKSFPLLLICSIVFFSVVVFSFTSCHANHKIEKVRSDYQNTNSYISGQLANTKDELDKTKKDFDQKKTDYVTEIADLKSDRNERLQSKDAEILKLTGERDSALQRAAMVESMPGNLFNIYTNIAANAPTNLNQFATILDGISNVVANASIIPKFKLLINNFPILKNPTVLVSTNRSIQIQVENDSDISAENLTILFFSTLDVTNFIKSDDWKQNGTTGNKQIVIWQAKADFVIAGGNSFTASTFGISTNYNNPILGSQIDIYSAKSKKQTYFINFAFLDGRQIPTNNPPPDNLIIDRGN